MSSTIKIILALSTLAACAQEDDAVTSSETIEIKNGNAWNPWTHTTETWTQNIVKIPGCTGTLLNPTWVMTAGHCFPDGTSTDMSGYYVSHLLADGTVEQAKGAEVRFHPQSHPVTHSTADNDDVDVALVRLETPLHPGNATLPLYSGTTASLNGQSVFCGGYGAIDSVVRDCANGESCPSGYSCDTAWNTCLKFSTSTDLRTATFTIKDDGNDDRHNHNIWYQFVLPNGHNQAELPGDSGSSCWNGSALTGVDKAGNGEGTYNRQNAIPAARAWIESLVEPVATMNRPGARCRPMFAGDFSYTSAGEAKAGSSDVNMLCPIDRPIAPTLASLAGGDVWVLDPSTTGDVCCQLVASNPGGGVKYGDEVCTSGSSSTYTTLELPLLRATGTFSHFEALCSVPAGDSVTSSRSVLSP